MSLAPVTRVDALRRRSRWAVPGCWAIGLVAYAIANLFATPRAVVWINDAVWTVASLVAGLLCMRTARVLESVSRTSWWWIASACLVWFVGQLHWDVHELVLGTAITYPNIGQVFYGAFPVLVAVGILRMPEVRHGTPLTPKHFGNVGLVVCCLLVTCALGLLEPALQTKEPLTFVLAGIPHTLLLVGTLVVALFALWTYSWSRSWTAMLLITLGASIHAVANLFYSYALLTNTYVESGLINASWCAVFGCVAWAAHERWWLELHPHVKAPKYMIARERVLEAVFPALLIVLMMGVAIAAAANISLRSLAVASIAFVVFAVILGAREAWIQNDTQRLHVQLAQANQQLAAANAELVSSEVRYSELNRELEEGVAQRTAELGRAYGELEGFAYAVAHDLKAPLRSINGFSHLLRQHLSGATTDEIDMYLARIRDGSLKMATLIDDLLAYSHIERRTLSVVPLDLRTTVDGALAPFTEEIERRKVQLLVEVEPLTLFADADGLMVVMRNLIENALKYSRTSESSTVAIRARRNGALALLEVADNGIGFDMAQHDKIFKIFQRLHRDDEYPGTGIGLALVRKAVERMQGRVWAHSEPGKGAVFFVELPLAFATEPAREVATASTP
jgi:signal transduction histidine kinase